VADSRPTAREINDTVRYTCWTVYRRSGSPAPDACDQLQQLVDRLAADDVVVRGWYDVSGMRAAAALMVWQPAPAAGQVQDALRRIRRTALGDAVTQRWSSMAVHRPAEFNKGHVPAFLAGHEPQGWVAVYPFVRSYDWYLLEDAERRDMLVEHGTMGREYKSVLSNTVAAFALGDYEWILALESEHLHDIVDMMRQLRSAKARLHVREEVPFFTGRRVSLGDAVDSLR
jgi:chlorite dismutase